MEDVCSTTSGFELLIMFNISHCFCIADQYSQVCLCMVAIVPYSYYQLQLWKCCQVLQACLAKRFLFLLSYNYTLLSSFRFSQKGVSIIGAFVANKCTIYRTWAFIFYLTGNNSSKRQTASWLYLWALIMYLLNLDFWHAAMMKLVKCVVLHGINALV